MPYKQHDVFKCLLELIKLEARTFRCFSLAHLWEDYLGDLLRDIISQN